MKRILPLLLLAAAACASGTTAAPATSPAPAPASAQPGIDPVVRMQLDSAVSLVRGQGFALQGAYHAGHLADGADRVQQLELRGGQSYLIMGVCGQGCTDLDMRLVDGSGAEVDSDFAPDDVPMVAAEVARDAAYRLTVTMADCGTERCAYGVAVFAQRR